MNRLLVLHLLSSVALAEEPVEDQDRLVAAVGERLDAQLPDTTECYTARLAADPSVEGSWVLLWTIESSGLPSGVSVEALGDPDPVLEQCLFDAVSAWTFPSLPAPMPVKKTVTFRPVWTSKAANKGAVIAAFDRQASQTLPPCWSESASDLGSEPITWTLQFAIEPTGKTTGITASAAERADAGVAACLEREIAGWTFPKPSQRQVVARSLILGPP